MDSKPKHYQVIARKYRPQTFSSVVGQEAIVTTLKNALRQNRLAHAYLFCGCRGTGKTTLARVFAKSLNCSQLSEDFEPCNACSSCLDINAGRSLDVLEIDGASNRGIDDVRQINETIGYAPASGKYKIYIIDEVHMLTKEAFNALLKTLEEPPANVKFFFATTEPHKVLPTIISRCQRFDLNRIPFEALKGKLAWIARDMNVECDEEVVALVANLSEGSLRDAESLFDQIICYAEHPITAAKVSATLGIMPHSVFFSLDKAFEEQTLSYAFELAGDIFSSGKDLSYFIDNLIEHFRSILKIKLIAPITFTTARLKERYGVSASLYTEEQALYILDFLIQWQQQIGKTPFKRVSLETILLHIIRSKNRLTLPMLVRRLHELEQKFSPLQQSSPLPQAIPEPIQPPISEVPIKEEEKVSVIPSSPPEKTSAPLPADQLEQIAMIQTSAPLQETQEASLEETLMKKIREKIDAAPALIEEDEEKPLIAAEERESAPETAQKPSILLSKSKWEAMAGDSSTQRAPHEAIGTPIETPLTIKEKKEMPAAPISQAASSNPASQSRYDTLIRFAAVELEGTIKKETSHG